MPLLSAVNLRIVLDSVSLSIEKGERVGVVGRNGEGKSTLVRALARILRPDEGQIQLAKGSRAGYLHQEPEFDPEETLRDAAEGALANLHQLHMELRTVLEAMAAADADLDALLTKQATLERDIDAAGGCAIDNTCGCSRHRQSTVDDLTASST